MSWSQLSQCPAVSVTPPVLEQSFWKMLRGQRKWGCCYHCYRLLHLLQVLPFPLHSVASIVMSKNDPKTEFRNNEGFSLSHVHVRFPDYLLNLLYLWLPTYLGVYLHFWQFPETYYGIWVCMATWVCSLTQMFLILALWRVPVNNFTQLLRHPWIRCLL